MKLSIIIMAFVLMATTCQCVDFGPDSGEFNSGGSGDFGSSGLDTDFDSHSGDSPSSFDVDMQSDEPLNGEFDSGLLSGHKGWKKHGGGHKWKKHGGHKGWKGHKSGHKGWKKHGGHKKWKKHGGHGWKKHGGGHKGHKKW